MGKKIKFPLVMKDDFQARELEGFQQHFDLKKAVEYFKNEKLQKWLESIYEDEILEKLERMSGDEEDFIGRFTEALGVECDTQDFDVQDVMEESQLKEQLKKIMPQEKVEQIIERVAETQEDLEQMVKENYDEIYLFHNSFCILPEMKNIRMIGIENPQVKIEEQDSNKFRKQKVKLLKVNPADEPSRKMIARQQGAYMELLDILEEYVKGLKNADENESI